MIKSLGKFVLKLCDNNNNYKNEINKELIYNINFNINAYIKKLLTNNNIYIYFKKINLTNEQINNYNIKFKIIKGIIYNFQLKIEYENNCILLKYATIPINIFDKNAFIKIENYNINNNKLNEITIYDYKDYIIYNILEYIININSTLLYNNYYIEIFENKIVFNLI
jgi:hypothetical protein